MAKLRTKDDLLNKLRAYAETPDDDNVRYKEKIRQTFMRCPELLYALHEKDLESELFCKDENGELVLNIDKETGELQGEVDRYFGESANIRPYLFIPETQTETKNYVCYQVTFDEIPRYSDFQKYTQITFTIFVNGKDREDSSTGIPRHDLIASIIRERINWSNIFGMQIHLISSKESTTDNNYLVRTLVFQITDTNSITYTPLNGNPTVINKQVRR